MKIAVHRIDDGFCICEECRKLSRKIVEIGETIICEACLKSAMSLFDRIDAAEKIR